MRDDSANQGRDLSVTFSNTPSDTELTILAVLGDCLKEITNLVLLGHAGSQTSCRPLVNHLDLTVEFLTVLVTVPVPGPPIILHLLDRLSGQVSFLLCSDNANKLSLASIGDKITLSRGILESDMGNLKNNLIITAKRVSPLTRRVTSLPLGQHSRIVGPFQVIVSFGDNLCKTLTVVVGLVNLKKDRVGIVYLRFCGCIVCQGMCATLVRTT